MKVAKVKAQLKTIGIADLKQICYATRVTMLEWQTERFIWTALCKTVQVE